MLCEKLQKGLLGAAAAVLVCASPSAQERDAPEPAQGWDHPVNAWGDPDLRGIWPIRHLIGVPLERPQQFGERRIMTDEEFAEVQQRVQERNTRYDEETEGNRMGIGHWAEPTEALRLTSLIVDPPDGRLPPLTEAGEARRAMMGSSWHNTVFDNLDDFDAWDRCISRGMPVSMLPRNYNNGVRILQSPGYVAIEIEMLGMRVIPLGDHAPPDSSITAWLGESVGRWEGNTLVVETTNYNGKSGLTNFGVPGSPREPYPSTTGLRTIERFTRVDDDTIEYQITMDDPEVLTRPFTIAYPMWRDDDYELFEYACHEGNTAVRYYIETSRYERARQATGRAGGSD